MQDINKRNPIMPIKLGEGLGLEKEHVSIEKPDLIKARYLQSAHTTPLDSHEQSIEVQQQEVLSQLPKKNGNLAINIVKSGGLNSKTESQRKIDSGIVSKANLQPMQIKSPQIYEEKPD